MDEAPPELPEPLPPDPHSIGAWRVFFEGLRAWARLAAVLLALVGASVVPVYVLLAAAAPTLTATMFGSAPEDVPGREWLILAGAVTLGMVVGILAVTASLLLADCALDGRPLPGPGATGARVLERVPAVLGTWLLMLLLFILPVVVLLVPVALGAARSGAAGAATGVAAALVAVVALGILLPALVMAGVYLRFGLPLAALREQSPLPSLRGSFALVRGRWWRTFGFLLLVTVPVQAVVMGAMAVTTMLLPLHPVLAAVPYGVAVAAGMSFQMVEEVALLRRLEAIREPAAGPLPAPA
jgi:hypothetical protein